SSRIASSPGRGAPGEALVGTVLDDRYLITSLLGQGGMAIVYRADDQVLGRVVAVKIFQSSLGSERDLRREISEIRTLASLNHHALVTLFDARIADNPSSEYAYLVMEYVEGSTLRARLDGGALLPGSVAEMGRDLAEALHVVHERGIVHRDVKPDNVLLSPSPTPNREFRAKLADFGIAMLTDSTRLTQDGTVVGTAAYLSPEQARGLPPASSSDIYSLGLVLLECLTGEKSFPGPLLESMAAKLSTDPNIPGDFGYQWKSILTAMTARDPELRPSAWGVAEALLALDPTLSGSLTIQTDGTVATEVLDAALGEPTSGVESTQAYEPTKVMPSVASAEAEPTQPVASSQTVESSGAGDAAELRAKNGYRWTKRRWLILVALVLVVIVVAAIWVAVALNSRQTGASAPSLPSVGGTLGDHLKQLLKTVTP
ncbi:MAG: eukaryotic-like serine/threonine-protein kinase, partial [Microbacteriaceae bacterium]|nr:eukaryotic-like serine/threonine-protein kinase [Microbacteriaceae bacterium]